MTIRKLPRPKIPEIDLGSTRTLIESANKHFPLITIHREKSDPDVCQIGCVASMTNVVLSLREIDLDAQWDDTPEKYRLAEITRVDFGGPYEEALALVAAANSG